MGADHIDRFTYRIDGVKVSAVVEADLRRPSNTDHFWLRPG